MACGTLATREDGGVRDGILVQGLAMKVDQISQTIAVWSLRYLYHLMKLYKDPVQIELDKRFITELRLYIRQLHTRGSKRATRAPLRSTSIGTVTRSS